MRILIVEDDPVSRLLIERVVTVMGNSVIRASGGRLAWGIVKDNPDIDLIITDISMPDLDGREFVRLVRADKKIAHIPIIMISGVISLHEISHALELGASRFMAKPIKAEELKQYVFHFAEQRQRQSQPSA